MTVLMLDPRYAKYLDSINIMISPYNIEISHYLTTRLSSLPRCKLSVFARTLKCNLNNKLIGAPVRNLSEIDVDEIFQILITC